MSSPSETDTERATRIGQQEAVAELGERALRTDDLETVLVDASSTVVDELAVEYSYALEQLPDDDELVLRQGVGWDDGLLGSATVPARPGSPAGHALGSDAPVVVDDFASTDRFSDVELLARNGVVSGIEARIGPPEDPWGVLGAHATESREFTDGDVVFLRTVANVVGAAVETERAKRRLREEEALNDRIIETSPVGITVVGPDGELEFANERAQEILGRDSEEIQTLSHDDPAWDLVDAGGEPMTEAETPFGRVSAAGEPVYDIELGLRRPDDERIWLQVSGAPLEPPAGAGEASTGAVFILADVTEQRRIEREFEEILGRITDAFYAIDTDFRFTHVNEQAAELLQRPADELLGEELWDKYPEAAEVDEVWDAFQTALHDQEQTSYEVYYPPLDFWVEANLYPSETGVSVYFRDVTERKEREQRLEEANERLRRSNERLEQFAYAASHDLQEPLRMVSSYLQLIERRSADELDGELQEFIDFAVDGADRMRDMVEGLLEYSRVDTAGDPLEPVDLDAVLEDVLEDLQLQIEEADAEVSSGSLPRVQGDASQLRQLFQNLLDNALTYSGDEPPHVAVSAERRGDEWVVSVSDEGVGIDPAETDEIFEVFQRLHGHDEHPGTGIGLALCQRIVERHRGDIWVESEPGEGSTFSFTLPAADGAAERR